MGLKCVKERDAGRKVGEFGSSTTVKKEQTPGLFGWNVKQVAVEDKMSFN